MCCGHVLLCGAMVLLTSTQSLDGVLVWTRRVDLHVGAQETGPAHAAGTLLCVPILEAPVMHVTLDVQWNLPAGRPASQHHLFPVPPLVRPVLTKLLTVDQTVDR